MPFDQANYEPTDAILKALQDARQFLSDPACWIKHEAFCRDDRANIVSACALGAIGMLQSSYFGGAVAYLRAALPEPSAQTVAVAEFNNRPTTTHADILALFDRAIAARKAELLKTPELGAVGAHRAA